MRIRFLGTGTSTGVPEIGCNCKVCTSTDHRDKRLRVSALVEIDERNILIDCSPDFRMQMLQTNVKRIDGVLLTHEHYDHVGGMDDLRPFCKFGTVDIYAEKEVVEAIQNRIPYVFAEHKYPGVPDLTMHAIENRPFEVKGITIIPVRLLHGRLPIFGYRIGKMAYLTDLKTIPKEEYEKLNDLDILIISSLRPEEHIAHETIADALENIRRINPKRTYLIHMSHQFGLHAEMENMMPKNVHIAYDGLEIV